MNSYRDNQYTRISKQKAFRLYLERKTFHLCPVKLRPGFPWKPDMAVLGNDHLDEPRTKETWENLLNNFCYYNCGLNETGYYPAYYVTEE